MRVCIQTGWHRVFPDGIECITRTSILVHPKLQDGHTCMDTKFHGHDDQPRNFESVLLLDECVFLPAMSGKLAGYHGIRLVRLQLDVLLVVIGFSADIVPIYEVDGI